MLIECHGNTDSLRNILKITGQSMRQIIHKRPKLKKSGPSKLRYDHVKILIGYGGEANPDEEEFADLFASIVVSILDVSCPKQIFDFLRNSEICGIPKDETDVRPICMGDVIRKCASIAFLKSTSVVPEQIGIGEEVPMSFNAKHFQNLQLGLAPNGCEIIIHEVRASLENFQHRDHFFADATLAYQHVSRMSGLNEVRKFFPHLLPFLREIYGQDSTGFYFSPDNIIPIDSKEGYHQGCILAQWLHSMAILPFLKGLFQILGEDGFVKFFFDDGNMGGDFENICHALRYIREEGPKYGYILQLNKGAYLMGQCGSYHTALERKEHLVKTFGLHEDSIFVHPEDGGDSKIYGAKVLGSFVGSNQFIQSKLEQKLEKLKKTAQNIVDKVGSKQIQLLLLRWCFSQKINYWQRTIPPDIMNRCFVKPFDDLKKRILMTILNMNQIDDKVWFLCGEKLANGGLGLHHTFQTSHSAFVASVIECSNDLEKFLHVENISEIDSPMFSQLKVSIDFIKSRSDPDKIISFESLKELIPKNGKVKGDGPKEALQHSISTFLEHSNSLKIKIDFSTPEEIAWLTSIKNAESGLAFDIAPKTSMHTISNADCIMMLKLRLRLPQQIILPGTKCDCSTRKKVVTVDKYGIHFCTGCNKDGVRIQTHNATRDHVEKILHYCGILTVKEEAHVFQTADPNNNKRADISALNLPDTFVKHLLDIRLTSPIPAINPESLIMADAVKVDRAANHSYNEKLHKYEAIASANNLGFIPIVFEITGRMHPVAHTLLEDIIKKTSRDRFAPFEAVWKYWISSLMIVIQKKLVEGIRARCSNRYGRNYDSTFESRHNVIIEIDRIHT